MIDINDVAALLHVEEKLRAHGQTYANMLAAVRAKLAQHEADHAPKPAEEPASEDTPVSTKAPAEPATNGDLRRPS